MIFPLCSFLPETDVTIQLFHFFYFKPVVPAGHPQACAYVVGERAGDLIKEAWTSSIPHYTVE